VNRKIVLLIEDNASDEALTLRALRKNNIGNDVVVVRDGAEALHYLAARRSDPADARAMPQLAMPQLVLLDLNLPKIDGLEGLRRIRADERTKLLPVVILTSSGEEQDIGRGYGLGANAYVRKPVDFIQFANAGLQLGLFWLIVNEPPPVSWHERG
jgi:two-component system, response regulator